MHRLEAAARRLRYGTRNIASIVPGGFALFCPQIRPGDLASVNGNLAVGDNLPRRYRNHTLESQSCPLNPLLLQLQRPYKFSVFRKSAKSLASDAQ
jgi:hypothetical protein